MKLSKDEFINKLKEELLRIDLVISEEQLIQLYEYKELLVSWNDKINLTAITDDEEIIKKHIVDSAYALNHINSESKVIDVGTGAGIPGMILAICNKTIKVTLLDALQKRTIFLQEVVNTLKLENVDVVHGRAEEIARKEEFRDKYDVVISRAVARLNVLMELTAPFAKIKGSCMYMKAGKTEEEISEVNKSMKELEVRYKKTYEYCIELNNEESLAHTIIEFTKQNKTKEKYPRQFAKIKKNPL
ncbi:MAG: 16S rRNA (guanine(527)-N(7))-methyltransferase RsmG [Clostridia bacterium]|nr:16S rRNA (guanine(527)-N(7))-methyltransferase RsmG [Clostridia bacterium]